LGTSFNVNTYKKTLKTTLIEGSVSLSYTNLKKSFLLKKNEQAIYYPESENVSIREVDPFYTIAWKNGAFAFENASISEIMEEISRWYNVSVEYEQDMSKIYFSGTISKYEDIHKLLNTISLTGSVKFKIDGRRILVMQ
jgi:ferric-dicitrate binding protein FerR (iron transport regulator)